MQKSIKYLTKVIHEVIQIDTVQLYPNPNPNLVLFAKSCIGINSFASQ